MQQRLTGFGPWNRRHRQTSGEEAVEVAYIQGFHLNALSSGLPIGVAGEQPKGAHAMLRGRVNEVDAAALEAGADYGGPVELAAVHAVSGCSSSPRASSARTIAWVSSSLTM